MTIKNNFITTGRRRIPIKNPTVISKTYKKKHFCCTKYWHLFVLYWIIFTSLRMICSRSEKGNWFGWTVHTYWIESRNCFSIRSHKPKRLGTTPPHSPEKMHILKSKQCIKCFVEYLSKTNNLQHLHNSNSICLATVPVSGQQTPAEYNSDFMDLNNNHFVTLSQNSVLYLTSLPPFVLPCSRVHGHVLQRAVWQVRHATAVRLLSILGPQLGVPEERHHGGNHQLWRWHHQPSGEWGASQLDADIAFYVSQGKLTFIFRENKSWCSNIHFQRKSSEKMKVGQ